MMNSNSPIIFGARRSVRRLMMPVIAILTLWPIINVASIISTAGANTLSNDYIYYAPLVDRILNGTYDWANYFRDTLIGGHSQAVPFLIELALAKLAHWNVYASQFLMIVLYVMILGLIYAVFNIGHAPDQHWRWILLPFLALMIFGLSQINIFIFPYGGFMLGFNQLGLVFGVWGLARFARRWIGIGLMVIGGLLASWSWGGGLIAWPTFLLGLIVLSYRNRWQYLVWLLSGLVAALPYITFLLLVPTRTALINSTFVSAANLSFIVNTLGRPFSNGFGFNSGPLPMAELSAWLGIGLSIIAVGIIVRLRRSSRWWKLAAPALMLIVYSVLSIWEMSLFRTTVSPWYSVTAMLFWIGLLGLGYLFWSPRRDHTHQPAEVNITTARLMQGWTLAAVAIIGWLYVSSNFSYEDKAFYLQTFSPASASCLRHFLTAPTYCEGYVFQWGVGNHNTLARLAQPLAHNRLSVFAPQQQWSLQGDYALDSVHIKEERGVPPVYWSADLTSAKTPWSSYKHLNLFLHTPAAIRWTVSLPANMKQANFYSAVAISQSAPDNPVSEGVDFEAHLQLNQQDDRLVFNQHLTLQQREWQPFNFSLDNYAGQTITLELTSRGGNDSLDDWAMYRYPYIDVLLDDSALISDTADTRPSNTDLSPQLPSPTANDYQFDLTHLDRWQAKDITQTNLSGINSWVVGQNPRLKWDQPLNICLADFDYFSVQMAVSPEIAPRAAEIYYQLDSQPKFSEAQAVTIPLLPDGGLHTYTYDLKLLELPRSARLTGVRFDPVYYSSLTGNNQVQLVDFRLIRNAQSQSFCAD